LGQVGQPSMVWVWIWKISPKNVNLFSLWVKKKFLKQIFYNFIS